MYIPPKLTQRELEVAPLLVDGVTRVEMAKHLKVSEETIKIHVRNILHKFDATSLRDCIIDITQYRDQFIKGLHQFYVPHLKTTLHLHKNRKDCEIISEFDMLAMKSGVDKISERYASDGHLPRVWINDDYVESVRELSGQLYTWNFPKPLRPSERQAIKVKSFFKDAFGKNTESHFNTIADPTGFLTLSVIFHTDELPEKVAFFLRQGIGGFQEIGRVTQPSSNEFRIEIDRPEYLNRYYIQWIWET